MTAERNLRTRDLPHADPIGRLVDKLPKHHWRQIVGIPRGGLIVASALGYRLDVHRICSFTTAYYRTKDGPPVVQRILCEPADVDGRRILLVEDGVATGTLLEHARTSLVESGAFVTTAALWVSTAHDYRPDVWVEEVNVPPSGASLLAEVSDG